MTLPGDIVLLAICNGMFPYDFDEIMIYHIFNPITGAYQLIPYPESTDVFGYVGLAVDYPNSNQYKLVTIGTLDENFNLFYKFHTLSSE